MFVHKLHKILTCVGNTRIYFTLPNNTAIKYKLSKIIWNILSSDWQS